MLGLLFGNLYGLKKAIDELTVLNGTQHIYETFQKSLLVSIKKSCSVLGENTHIGVQLTTLFRGGESRKLIKEFFLIEFKDITSFNQLMSDDKGIEELSNLLLKIVEDYNSKANHKISIDITLAKNLITQALEIFADILLQNLSELQGNGIQILQGIENAKLNEVLRKSIKGDTEKLLEGQEKLSLQIERMMLLFNGDKNNRESFLDSRLLPFFQKIIDSVKADIKSYHPQKAIDKLVLLENYIEDIDFNKNEILATICAHLGNCYTLLKDTKQAASYRIKAVDLMPESINHLYSSVNAHFYYEQLNKIENVVHKIEQIDPDANEAVALRLLLNDKVDSIDELAKTLTEENLESLEVLFALHKICIDTKEYDKQLFYIQRAAELFPADNFIKRALAATLFQGIGEKMSPMIVPQLTKEMKKNLKKAKVLYGELWNDYKKTPIKAQNVDLLIQSSIINLILGKRKTAFKQIEKSISIAPKLDEIKFQKMLMLIEAGRAKDVLKLANKIDLDKNNDARLLIAEVHYNTRNVESAIEQLVAFLNKATNNSHNYSNAQRLLICAQTEVGNTVEAKRIFEDYKKKPISRLNLLYLEAKISAKELKENIVPRLDEMSKLLNEDTDVRDRIDIAESYYLNRKWNKSIEIYESFIEKIASRNLTYHYINAHFKSGQWQKVVELCRKAPFHDEIDPEFTFLETAALSRLKQYEKALEIGQKLLDKEPDNVHNKIQVAKIYMVSGDKVSAANLLDDIPHDSLRAFHYESIISIYGEAKDFETALFWAFKYRNKINKANAHNKYWQIMSFWIEDESDICSTPEQVATETAVTVKIDNEKERTFLFVKPEESIGKDVIISSKHPAYHKMLGLKVDDTFVWDKNSVEERMATIISIRTKWVHAYQETIETLELEFPNEKLFKILKNGIESIEKMLILREKEIEDIEKFIEIVIPHFNKGVVPISLFAKKIGLSTIETFALCQENPDLGIKCSVGTIEDSEKVTESLSTADKNGMCADIVGLLSLYNFDLGKVVVETFGKIKITPSTYDEMLLALANTELKYKREGHSIYRQEGVNYRRETPLEIKAEKFRYYDEFKKWIDTYCMVLPVENNYEETLADKRLNEPISVSSLETIQLCQENDAVLFTDDLPFRFIAAQNSGLQILWIMPLIRHFGIIEKITFEQYLTYQLDLIKSNYNFIGFNSDTLRFALETDFKDFQIVVKKLKGPDCTYESAMIMAMGFLVPFWIRSKKGVKFNRAVTAIICQGLTQGRNKFKVFIQIYSSVRFVKQLSKERYFDLCDAVREWAKIQGVYLPKQKDYIQ